MAQATDAVWLPVLPDMSSFGKGIVKGADKEADSAGKSVGKRFGTAMLAGVAVVGAGAAAATKALYSIGETFDDVTDTIRVGTGATGKDLEGLVDSAKNVGRNVPAEFEAVGTMVADVNTRLGLTGETLETFAAQALEAGRIMGEEIDINAMSAAFNVFQIQGEDTTAAMDHLFRVSQATGVGMNELAANVAANAPAVQGLGFSFEETAALVGNLDKAGLNSSKMMAGMGRALVELAKDGEEPQEAFKRVTGEIQGYLDEGNKAAAVDLASQLFDTRNASQFIGALETGALAMDDLGAVAGMTEDTILGAGQETMDFAEQWQMFKNNVLVELEPIASRVFAIVGDGMAWIKDNGIPAAKDFAETLRDWAPVIGGVVAAFGALVAVTAAHAAVTAVQAAGGIAAWIAQTKIAAAVSKAWAAVQWVLNAALTANPIGIVVVAIAGLVAALVVAWNHSETFRAVVTAAWEGIKAAASAVWDWMKQAFQWIKDGLSSVAQWFKDRGRDIALAWDAMKAALKAGWDWIRVNVFDAIKAGLSAVGQWFTDRGNDIKNAWNSVKDALKAGYDFIKKYTFDAFVAGVGVVWDFFRDRVADIRGVWDGLKGAFKSVWDWIDQNVFQNFKSGIETVVGWVGDAVGAIRDVWQGLKEAFLAPINWVIREVWNGGIVRVFNAVADVIPGVGRMSEQPEIRARAKGGYTPPGWTLVGEEGPELVNFTHPNRVYTAAETRAMLAGQAANPVQSQFSRSNPPHGGVGGWFSDRWDDVKSGARWVADGVRDAAGNVVKWARGGLAKAAGIVLNPIKSLISSTLGSAGRFGELAGGMATSSIDRVLEWVAGHDEGAAPDAGGRSLRGALPYVNNAAHALADAVGGIRTMQAFNQSMAGGHPAGKAVDFIDSVSKLNRLADIISGGGHFDNFNYMAWQGRLWSPGRGWRPQGRGYGNDPMHQWHLHAEWYDQGGMLKPGMGVYANATGSPEPVLTSQQWRDVSTLAAAGAGAGGPMQIEGELTLVNGRAYISGIARQETQAALQRAPRLAKGMR